MPGHRSGMTPEAVTPRADEPSPAAALAGTARPSHRPAPDRRSPFPRSRRSAPRAPTLGYRTSGPRVCADHQDRARPVASPHEGMLRPGGTVEEVPGAEASLLALDEQPALAGQNEERLLIGLGVIHAALARLEHGDVDPELLELDRGFAVLVREPARRSPRFGRPPLGIAHVDDEPAFRHGGKPGTGVLTPRFGHGPRFLAIVAWASGVLSPDARRGATLGQQAPPRCGPRSRDHPPVHRHGQKRSARTPPSRPETSGGT